MRLHRIAYSPLNSILIRRAINAGNAGVEQHRPGPIPSPDGVLGFNYN